MKAFTAVRPDWKNANLVIFIKMDQGIVNPQLFYPLPQVCPDSSGVTCGHHISINKG
jgi:hypothetical protein